jgi:hypothetical protein
VEYSKYNTSNWTLSKLALEKIAEFLDSLRAKNIRVVEFGSGVSTEFLHDYAMQSSKNVEIVSFENMNRFAYKPTDDDPVDLKMRPLVCCTDEDFAFMFSEGELDQSLMGIKKGGPSTRQKNTFYDVREGDLSGKYNLVILDGPNGNGRSLGYLHVMPHLKRGTVILIHNHSQHGFLDTAKDLFEGEIVFESGESNEFALFRIKKLKS